MTPAEFGKRAMNDFDFYAKNCLKVLDKGGNLVSFEMNKAQRFLHDRLEAQLADKGYIRAIVLKGRQMGCSTYLQARMRWKMKHRTGVKGFVMAHEEVASTNLFNMAKRYHDNEPALVRPAIGASNAKELWFKELDTRYAVATAGSKETGRSSTAQYFHGSEYAFWQNADNHWAGIGQTVPLMPDTEVYVESTANGLHNDFYSRWKQAINGKGDYIAIFMPWFWMDEYRREDESLVPTEEEAELMELYGLTREQIAWRRSKIETDFNGDATRFQQEYPSNWQEAFVAEKRDTYIPGKLVLRAQKQQSVVPAGALVLGCDPARYGDDATAIVVRQGRKVRAKKRYEKKSTMEIAGIVARFIESTPELDRAFIDVIGIGAGVYDRLVELGYGEIVQAVNFAESATDDERFANKRAECWGEMKEWLENQPCSLPEGDEWLGDLTAPGYVYDSSGRLRLEKKEDIKKRDGKSPDVGDALALTFAEPVRAGGRKPKVKMKPQAIYDEATNY